MRKSRPFRQVVALAAFGAGVVAPLQAGAASLYFDRAAFMADAAVTATAAIDFDALAAGTDLTGQWIAGVAFNAPGTSPLEVMVASTGVRYGMSASSGLNVLSPGGRDAGLQNDDLELVFATPVRAAGLDVVFDAPDGASFVGVAFYDELGNVITSYGFIPAPNGAPGYQFVGAVSSTANIKRVVFDEYDDSAWDDHVAYDSVVFTAPAVPEPSTYALLALGIAGLSMAARRRRAK